MENSNDDIHDTEYLTQFPDISTRINLINDSIIPLFNTINKEAERYQQYHKYLTITSTTIGTFALILALIQFHYTSNILLWRTEWIILLSAIALVLSGSFLNYHQKWLVARHKAERLRQLKFRQIIHPLSSNDFNNEINEINSFSNIKEINKWIIQRGIKWNALGERNPNNPVDFPQLIEYYINIRLSKQIEYFESQVTQNRIKDIFTKFIPPILFFGSIFTAGAHIICEELLISQMGDSYFTIQFGSILILITIMFPVIGASIKTIRGAGEYKRNYERYSLITICLKKIYSQIMKRRDKVIESDKSERLFQSILMDMQNAEEILEYEHQEWIRLMADAEWFG